ncbi:MAG: hypothetical protein WBW04_14455 [Nitrolancea sp.]
MAQLKGLTEAGGHEAVDTAQRFLASAYDAVDAVLETLDTVRQVRKQTGGDIRGRLTANEEDLLRAAVVFTGAGLDSVLKQLIRDSLPDLLKTNDQAHDKFEAFARDRVGTGEIADSAMIARYLTSENPRERLIEDYIYELTGSSLQSADEVQKVAGALGIGDANLRKRITKLRELFVARNEISHELDLQRPEQRGDRTRRSRAMKPTKALCHEGLEVAQLMVNEVGRQL